MKDIIFSLRSRVSSIQGKRWVERFLLIYISLERCTSSSYFAFFSGCAQHRENVFYQRSLLAYKGIGDQPRVFIPRLLLLYRYLSATILFFLSSVEYLLCFIGKRRDCSLFHFCIPPPLLSFFHPFRLFSPRSIPILSLSPPSSLSLFRCLWSLDIRASFSSSLFYSPTDCARANCMMRNF